MSSVKTRLSGLLGHLASPEVKDHPAPQHRINYHTLSPTFFLPRAAAIEPDVRLFPPPFALLLYKATVLVSVN